MKRRFTSIWRDGLQFIEWYFLGRKPEISPCFKSFAIMGHVLNKGSLMIFDESLENNIFEFLEILDSAFENDVVFLMPAQTLPRLSFSYDYSHIVTLLALPSYLEEVPIMVKEIEACATAPSLFILCNLSMLPAFKEQSLKSATDTSFIHQRSFARMLEALIRLHKDRKFIMVLIDNEATLGNKNSALLRRLFCRS